MTPRTRLPVRRLCLAIAIALAAWGCGGSGAAETYPDVSDAVIDLVGEPDPGVGDGDDLPAPPLLVRACEACHDLEALTGSPAGSAGDPRDWLAKAGQGLVRDEPAIPEPDVRFSTPWPKRGRHDPDPSGEACGACHPVNDQGQGHDLRGYPMPDRAFLAGQGCAEGCHAWLAADPPLQPLGLLQQVDTAHARLWREGARVDGQRLTVILPGCGGCHNARAEAHGALLTCLDCHTLGGPDGSLHQAHVVAVEAGQEVADPQGAAAGVTACGYCHDADDGVPLERWRRGCHGCHLSGHQPLDVTGRPHFWPAAE